MTKHLQHLQKLEPNFKGKRGAKKGNLIFCVGGSHNQLTKNY